MCKSKIVKRWVVTASLIFLLQIMLWGQSAHGEWWNKDWKYKLPAVIDNTKNTDELNDFQCCLVLDTEEFIYSEKMQKKGEDIRFTDEKGKELPCWIEKGINTDATRIWVKISHIPANSKQTIYLHYGNPKAESASSFDDTMTKDFGKEEGLVAIYHLDEGFADEVKDSSGNENHGKTAGNPEWTQEDGGIWADRADVMFSRGSALKFNGDTGQCVTIPYSPSMDITDGVTLEAWINPAALHRSHPKIFGREDYGAAFPYGIIIDYQDYLRISIASSKAINGGTPEGTFHFNSLYAFRDSDIGKWFHVAGSYSATKGEAALYIDGTENARWPLDPERFPKEAWGIKVREGPLMIGGGDKPFAGIIDELRLYNRVLNADEIKVHYERRKYTSSEPTVDVNMEKEETLK